MVAETCLLCPSGTTKLIVTPTWSNMLVVPTCAVPAAGVQGSGLASDAVLYSHKFYPLLALNASSPSSIVCVENPANGKTFSFVIKDNCQQLSQALHRFIPHGQSGLCLIWNVSESALALLALSELI